MNVIKRAGLVLTGGALAGLFSYAVNNNSLLPDRPVPDPHKPVEVAISRMFDSYYAEQPYVVGVAGAAALLLLSRKKEIALPPLTPVS